MKNKHTDFGNFVISQLNQYEHENIFKQHFLSKNMITNYCDLQEYLFVYVV